mmetsp:Transcript_46617/g.141215  ORF Transcript_46617/g.141215 Transcript_46617/m.141215 type:complete len:233 (-) Transcript_46617:165-863(-)
MFNSIRLVQIILNLIASQDPKFTTVRFGDNPHLNVLRRHLALEPFAEGEESRVNRVLQFHVVRVPLLEEVLGVDVVLSNGRRLPTEIRPAGIDLIQSGRTVGVRPGDQQRHPERTHPARLSVLLHHSRGRLDELRDRDGFAIVTEVGLGRFAGLPDQHPVIRTYTAVHHPNTSSSSHPSTLTGDSSPPGADGHDLSDLLVIDQFGTEFFIGSDDDAVLRGDSQRCPAIRHGV